MNKMDAPSTSIPTFRKVAPYIVSAALFPALGALLTYLQLGSGYGRPFYEGAWLWTYFGPLLHAPRISPYSLLTEIEVLIFNPGFYAGLTIGYLRVRGWSDLWKALIPNAIALASALLVLIIPGGIWAVGMVGVLVIFTGPYALLGGVIGWVTAERKRKQQRPNHSLDRPAVR